MKIRIKFSKTGHMRYIGHLDIMRYFQKLMRRAEVDIKYSEGFSPHQIMSFAQPLGLGDTSEGEYVDIEVGVSEGSKEMLRIADETRRSNAMSLVAAADYRIFFRRETPDAAALHALLSQKEILVKRRTKTKETEADLRPMIFDWALEGRSLWVRLAAGSAANCKPDTLMEAYDRFRGAAPPPFACHFHRLEMYARQEENFIPLYQLGEELP